MMSTVDIRFGARLTASASLIRVRRTQARPRMTAGSNAIRSNRGVIEQCRRWS
jgi:hypothetical protein